LVHLSHFIRKLTIAACCTLLLTRGSAFAAQAIRTTGKTPASQDQIRREISDYLRKRFSVSSDSTITVGPLQPSMFPDFYTTLITVKKGQQSASQRFYVSKDGRYLLQGNLYTLGADPFQEVERQISTKNVQAVGPANAPVTIVEYSDLECPVCAQAQDFIEKQLLPKYGSQVRVIFKDFPLVNIHHWALPAAMINQCAFQLDPARSLTYRSLVFQNQGTIKDDDAQNQLLDLAQKAGLDRAKIAACFDAKTTAPLVQKEFEEGERLGVSTTPTLFINGKMVAGIPSPSQFYQIVDKALAQAKLKPASGK
jgi:protein-disulfide isomerase